MGDKKIKGVKSYLFIDGKFMFVTMRKEPIGNTIFILLLAWATKIGSPTSICIDIYDS